MKTLNFVVLLVLIVTINLPCFSQKKFTSFSIPDTILVSDTPIEYINPVTWSVSCKKVSVSYYIVAITASIAPGWHVWAEKQLPESICEPTVIKIEGPVIKYTVDDSLTSCCTFSETRGIARIQEIKELNIRGIYYSDSVTFERIIMRKTSKGQAAIKVSVTYKPCSDKTCLPTQTAYFYLKLK